jgi:hypothetical protein
VKKEAPRLAPVLAVVFGAAALRFAPFLAGGTLYRRDAGFFFVPWRLVLARFLRSGEAPLWNEWMSAGRAFAADPNAAVFWPLSPLLVVFSPTALALANVFLALGVFFFALRRLGLSTVASGAGTLVLLFSGVFQSLPVYATTCAAALPLSLALVEAPRLAAGDTTVRRRACALAALAFGLSALGGEPAVTLMGAAAFVAVAIGAGKGSRPRATAAALSTLVLGVGLAAIQILPAALEMARSARGARRASSRSSSPGSREIRPATQPRSGDRPRSTRGARTSRISRSASFPSFLRRPRGATAAGARRCSSRSREHVCPSAGSCPGIRLLRWSSRSSGIRRSGGCS